MSVNFMSEFDFSRLEHYQKGGAVLPNPDQFVGNLEISGTNMAFIKQKRDTIDYNKEGYVYESGRKRHGKNLLVILESPHRYEYDSQGRPLGLAMGNTGDNFFDLFPYALKNSPFTVKDGDYNVIFANGVQYQASCGLSPLNREIRDKNWLDVYDNHGGEADFKKRIRNLNPEYIINLCTGGKKPSGLRQRINQTLDAMGYEFKEDYTEGNHPAAWKRHGDTSGARIY